MWMDLENILLREISQKNTNIMWYHLYIESKLTMDTKHRHIRKTSYAQKCSIISIGKQMNEHTNTGNLSQLHTFLVSS